VASNQGYIARDHFDQMLNSFKRLSGMLSSLIDYLNGSRMRGEKYKKPTYKSLGEELEGLTRQKP